MADYLDEVVNEIFKEPTTISETLERLLNYFSQSHPYSLMHVWHKLHEIFWGESVPGSTEMDMQTCKRQSAQSWALKEFENSFDEHQCDIYRLQLVLTTLLATFKSYKEVIDAIPSEIISDSIVDGLVNIIIAAKMDIQSGSHRHRGQQLHEDIISAGRCGNYRQLGYLMQHLEVELSPDVHLSILFLNKSAPERLSSYIKERKDALFSIAVRDVLDDGAAQFALLVDDITFKFVCVMHLSNFKPESVPSGAIEILRDLLLQMAESSHWRELLSVIARYPQTDTVSQRALSEALARLSPDHWSAFVDAVELWSHTGTVVAVTNILVPFLHAIGNDSSSEMWRFAYERWNKWDYGHDNKEEHMSSPSACSLDFPVAMYYALLTLEDNCAEEAQLLKSIDSIEQNWFADISTLVTHRNRLSSRLRLVQHGQTIRDAPPTGANPLPPPIQPDSRFAAVRYHFYDVHSSIEQKHQYFD